MSPSSWGTAAGPQEVSVGADPLPHLKTERVHHRVYATRDQARRDLFGYIEGFYNPRRLHSALGYISPADMERRAA